MDFGRAIEIIGKRKWLILLSVVITTLLTWGATRLTGARYLATVKFVAPISSPLTEAPNSKAEGTPLDPKAQSTLYGAIVKSPDVIDGALAKIHYTPQRNFLDRVDFEPNGNRMFELKVTESTTDRAQELANALADGFVESYRQINTKQARDVVDQLEEQVHKADEKLKSARARYDAYCAAHQVLGNPGNQLTLELKRLEQARLSRDEATARYAQARERLRGHSPVESAEIPNTFAQPMPETPAEPRTILKKLQDELDQSELQLLELKRRYEEKHPTYQNALRHRDELQERLRQEIAKNPVRKLPPGPAAAQAPAPSTGASIEDLQQEMRGSQAAIAVENKNIAQIQADLAKLRSVDGPVGAMAAEITAQSEARTNLVTRLNSARMNLDLAAQQNPLVILEHVGGSNPPVSQTAGRTQKLILLGALCSLLISSGLAIVFDSVDRRLKNLQEADMLLPVRVLAAIPQPIGEVTPQSLARATELHPLSAHAEAYRFLGQHILSIKEHPVRALMVISAKGGQGNTSTIINLAITLAQSGHRVILVDANTRNPRLHLVFNVTNEYGLTNVLHQPNAASVQRALHPTSVPELQVVTSGPASENPWELFSSNRLEEMAQYLHARADYVLFDTPSAVAFTDTLNLAPIVDAALLCVRVLEPLSGAENRLVELFEQAHVVMLGSVLTDVPAAMLQTYQGHQRYAARGTNALVSLPAEAAAAAAETPAAPFFAVPAVPDAARQDIYAAPDNGRTAASFSHDSLSHDSLSHDSHSHDSQENFVTNAHDSLQTPSELQTASETAGTQPTDAPQIVALRRELAEQTALSQRLTEETTRLAKALEAAQHATPDPVAVEHIIEGTRETMEAEKAAQRQNLEREWAEANADIEQMRQLARLEAAEMVNEAGRQSDALLKEAQQKADALAVEAAQAEEAAKQAAAKATALLQEAEDQKTAASVLREEVQERQKKAEVLKTEAESLLAEAHTRYQDAESRHLAADAKEREIEAQLIELVELSEASDKKRAALEAEQAAVTAKQAELDRKRAEMQAAQEEITARLAALDARENELTAQQAESERHHQEAAAKQAQAEQTLMLALQERDRILAMARESAEAIQKTKQTEIEQQSEKILSSARRQAEKITAAAQEDAQHQRTAAEQEALALRSRAEEEADRLLAESRRSAEETNARANAAYNAIRSAVEEQLARLPNPTVFSGTTMPSATPREPASPWRREFPALDSDWLNLDWKARDWQNGS